MRYFACIAVMLLGVTGAMAQNPVTPETPVPQTVPQQNPAPATVPETKPEFNAPQSPNRQPQTPSEDTLIKGRTSSGAVIHDTLVPAAGRKKERMDRRKNRKGTAETDDTTGNAANADPVKKP